MNEQEFFSMDIEERARMVNDMLGTIKKDQLVVAAEQLGIPYNRFTKEMQRGNFVYIKRLNKYCKFIEEWAALPIPQEEKRAIIDNDLMKFLADNMETLQQLSEAYQKRELIINRNIISKEESSTNRTIKFSDSLYKEFSDFSKNEYPQYRMPDLMAQALWEFLGKYSLKNN